MAEDYGLAAAPVLIINLNAAGVLPTYGNIIHGKTPSDRGVRLAHKHFLRLGDLKAWVLKVCWPGFY